VEGLNNKPKSLMRKSYGFRTYRVLELALYHSLGKLPELDGLPGHWSTLYGAGCGGARRLVACSNE
jgi:hypothetical protein